MISWVRLHANEIHVDVMVSVFPLPTATQSPKGGRSPKNMQTPIVAMPLTDGAPLDDEQITRLALSSLVCHAEGSTSWLKKSRNRRDAFLSHARTLSADWKEAWKAAEEEERVMAKAFHSTTPSSLELQRPEQKAQVDADIAVAMSPTDTDRQSSQFRHSIRERFVAQKVENVEDLPDARLLITRGSHVVGLHSRRMVRLISSHAVDGFLPVEFLALSRRVIAEIPRPCADLSTAFVTVGVCLAETLIRSSGAIRTMDYIQELNERIEKYTQVLAAMRSRVPIYGKFIVCGEIIRALLSDNCDWPLVEALLAKCI